MRRKLTSTEKEELRALQAAADDDSLFGADFARMVELEDSDDSPDLVPQVNEYYHWSVPGWPGAYDSEVSAIYATQFGHEVLERLQASVNPGGVIGLGMLQRAWAGEIPETWEQRLAREAAEAKERKRCSQCRKLVANVSNLNGERLCGPCLSRRSAVAPTPCIFPGCGVKSMGGRCRAHRYYEAPTHQKDRRALLAKKVAFEQCSFGLTETEEQIVDRLLGRVLGVFR